MTNASIGAATPSRTEPAGPPAGHSVLGFGVAVPPTLSTPRSGSLKCSRDKTALVTGSTSGIGLGIATALASRRRQRRSSTASATPPRSRSSARSSPPITACTVRYDGADLSQQDAIESMMGKAIEEFGAVDILVNNAGIQFVAPIDEFPVAKWNAILALNLTASFHTIRLALPTMKAKKWGRIVNIASAHALVASPYKSAYVAAKHGIAGPHQDRGARSRDAGHHDERDLSRLRLDAARREADSRHREGARADRRRR